MWRPSAAKRGRMVTSRSRVDGGAAPLPDAAAWDGEDDGVDGGVESQAVVAMLHEKGRFAAAAYFVNAERMVVHSHACDDADVVWMLQGLQQALPPADATRFVVSSSISEAARQVLQSRPNVAAAPVEGGAAQGGGVANDSGGAAMAAATPTTSIIVAKASTFHMVVASKLVAALRGPGWQAPKAPGSSRVDGIGTASRPTTAASVATASTMQVMMEHPPSRMWLDPSDSVAVRAVGALLHHLLSHGIVVESHESGTGDPVVYLPGGIHFASLCDFMILDPLTMAALNITSLAAHPCIVAPSSAGKEGFSVTALLNRAVSTPGATLLQRWCRQPSLDVELLRHRHDAVAFFVHALQLAPDAVQELRASLKRSKDMPRLLLRMKRVRARPRDWFALQQTILAFNMAKDTVSNMLLGMPALLKGRNTGDGGGAAAMASGADDPYSDAHPFLLTQYVVECTSDLLFLQATLDNVIDWDMSRLEGRLCTQTGLDATLDEYRRAYAGLPAYLGEESVRELQRHPALTSLTIRYVPQIGCVIAVEKEAGMAAPATAAPDGFEFQYETATEMVYKNDTMHALDKYFGDILATIHDMEASIVRQLEERLLEYESALLTVGGRLAELDVLLAFADVSRAYGYCRPTVTEEPVLLVKEARHPLQELTVDTFVPNDIAMQPGSHHAGSVMVVTGPNASGKSIYLKTAGVVVYMAQIGCFVPATRAIVGAADRMFSRIHTLESAALNHSSFTIDLTQVGMALRHATPRSLLLVDEFGKGTASLDGAALLAATLRHLTQPRGTTSHPPRCIVTTHFREVLTPATFPGPEASHLAYYRMDVLLHAAEGGGGDDEVTPLFKLVPGCSTSSYGVACARAAGVGADVLARATAVTRLLHDNKPIMPASEYVHDVRRKAREAAMVAVLRKVAAMAAGVVDARPADTGAECADSAPSTLPSLIALLQAAVVGGAPA